METLLTLEQNTQIQYIFSKNDNKKYEIMTLKILYWLKNNEGDKMSSLKKIHSKSCESATAIPSVTPKEVKKVRNMESRKEKK